MLSAHRGEFIYDRELGSGIHLIDKNQENAAGLVEISAREALKEFPFCEVKSAEVSEEKIRVKTEIYGKEYQPNPYAGHGVVYAIDEFRT